MAHIEKLLANIREGRGLLNAVVHDEEMAGRFRSVMRNLDQSSGGLAGVMDEVQNGDGLANEIIYGDEGVLLAKELGQLASSLGRITKDIQSEDSMIHALIYDPEKAKILDDLGEAIVSLKRTSAALENGEGTLGLLANDPALYEDLRALVGGAQRNKLLRAYIRKTIEKGEQVNASAWTPETE